MNTISSPGAGETGGDRDLMIRCEKAALGYGGVPVLSNVDLDVSRGDFLGLVGPNGAGKTTLLRGFIGALRPLAGRILIGAEVRRGALRIGYVPQVQHLDPLYPFTVREVVAMGGFRRLGPLGRMKRDERDLLDACLGEVDMAGHGAHPFNRLSAGQKQRVLVARALFTRPDLLLLDEPTSGADASSERRFMKLLARLHGEGHTILLVCHELDTIRRTVKEVLWVHRGRVRRMEANRLDDEALLASPETRVEAEEAEP